MSESSGIRQSKTIIKVPVSSRIIGAQCNTDAPKYCNFTIIESPNARQCYSSGDSVVPFYLVNPLTCNIPKCRAFFNIQAGGQMPPQPPLVPPPRNHILPPPQEKSLFPKIIQTNQRRLTNT